MSEKSEVCLNCKWWKEKQHPFSGRRGEIGECRAVPPSSSDDKSLAAVTDAKWPTTENDDYCRYFEHRDDRAARLLTTRYGKEPKGEAA